MHLILLIAVLLILVPAALAGIGEGLLDAVSNLDCLVNTLPHANALLAELSPLAPALALLLTGLVTLGLATWLTTQLISR